MSSCICESRAFVRISQAKPEPYFLLDALLILRRGDVVKRNVVEESRWQLWEQHAQSLIDRQGSVVLARIGAQVVPSSSTVNLGNKLVADFSDSLESRLV